MTALCNGRLIIWVRKVGPSHLDVVFFSVRNVSSLGSDNITLPEQR